MAALRARDLAPELDLEQGSCHHHDSQYHAERGSTSSTYDQGQKGEQQKEGKQGYCDSQGTDLESQTTIFPELADPNLVNSIAQSKWGNHMKNCRGFNHAPM